MKNIKEQILASLKSGDFLRTVCDIYQTNRENHDNLSQVLSSLHNDGNIDVITEFQKLTKSDFEPDFFMTRHILELILSDIKAPVSEVMECTRHLTLEAGQDLAAGTLIQPFINYLEAKNSRPQEVLDIALDDIDDTFDFITPAIIAGTKSNLVKYADKTIELSQHPDINIQIYATHALGRINYFEKSVLIDRSVQAIKSIVTKNYNEYLFASSLRASYSLLSQDKSAEDSITEIFQRILEHKEDYVLHAASEILSFEEPPIPKKIVDILLDALIETKSQNHKTIGNIDQGITGLIKGGEIDRVVLFLENILLNNHEISIKQFANFSREIISSHTHRNKIITRWLLSKSVRLGRDASALLSIGFDKGIILTADLDQIPDSEHGTHSFLAKKACGWLFLNQISAASFILSLIDDAPNEDVKIISQILFNPLLISFPESVRGYLDIALENASTKLSTIIKELIDQFNLFHKNLRSANDIKELYPSQSNRETYSRRQNGLMSESQEKADKNSIWRMLATPLMLLYGNKMIHYIQQGKNDQAIRQEVPLQEFSFSMELPAADRFDQNGLDYMLRGFKLEGCTK